MKHNKNRDNAKSDGLQLQPVRFEFTHPTARTVCVAGTFDNWRADAKPMHALGGGRWLKETVLPPGTYEYCGGWQMDARSVGQGDRAQSVRRAKLGSQGRQVAGRIPPCQRRTFTTGKHQ